MAQQHLIHQLEESKDEIWRQLPLPWSYFDHLVFVEGRRGEEKERSCPLFSEQKKKMDKEWKGGGCCEDFLSRVSRTGCYLAAGRAFESLKKPERRLFYGLLLLPLLNFQSLFILMNIRSLRGDLWSGFWWENAESLKYTPIHSCTFTTTISGATVLVWLEGEWEDSRLSTVSGYGGSSNDVISHPPEPINSQPK